MVRKPAPKGKARAPKPPKGSRWQLHFTRPVTVTRGPQATLASLADARRFILKNFGGVTRDAGLGRAVELLFTAAETGRLADRQKAAAQMELLLRRRHWL